MNRLCKLIINIHVIFALLAIVLYSKGYRLSAESASMIYVEKSFLNAPSLIDQVMVDKYGIFLYQQDNTRACSVVENRFFLWRENTYNQNEANFGNFTYNLEQYHGDDLEYMDYQCLSAYDIYYNTDLKDLMKIGNIVEAYDDPFIEIPEVVYQVPHYLDNSVFIDLEDYDLNLSLSKLSEQIKNTKNVLIYEDGASASSRNIDNVMFINQSRADINLMFGVNYEFDYLNMETTIAFDAYKKRDEVNKKIDEYFLNINDINYFETIDELELIRIFYMYSEEANLEVTNVKASINLYREIEDKQEFDSLYKFTNEEYAEYHNLLIVPSDLSYEEISKQTYAYFMDTYGYTDLLIISKDNLLIQLGMMDFVEIVGDIEIENSIISVGINPYYASDFETLLNTPDLKTEIKRIVKESYYSFETMDQARDLMEKINFTLADYFGIQRNRLKIRLITNVIDDMIY